MTCLKVKGLGKPGQVQTLAPAERFTVKNAGGRRDSPRHNDPMKLVNNCEACYGALPHWPDVERDVMQSRTNIIRLLQRDRLMREIVERCTVETRERLGADLANMSAAELRGYVRARATAPVLTDARRLIAERRLNIEGLTEFVEQSIERVTHSIVREAAISPIVSLPCAAIPMRAAA